ncbi:hypothetical protein [Helicobacter pylori]|nr:hypothetical protein [Helicobacter pylori]
MTEIRSSFLVFLKAIILWVTPLKFKYYKYYYNATHTNHLEES